MATEPSNGFIKKKNILWEQYPVSNNLQLPISGSYHVFTLVNCCAPPTAQILESKGQLIFLQDWKNERYSIAFDSSPSSDLASDIHQDSLCVIIPQLLFVSTQLINLI